jgi:large conductance mechanosensitive channel
MQYLRDFKTFVMRGNVIDLAVAVVIGAAFTAVVTAVVGDIVTPLIAAIGGKPDFSALTFTINKSQFQYGAVINAIVSFLAVALVVFFLIVRPINALDARRKRGQEPEPPDTRQCPECLSDIPTAARRCAFCTSVVSD